MGTVGIYSSITPGYFDSIGVRILRGRDFTDTEARMAGANRVCIVDQGMAEKLFPGEAALGRRVRFAEPTAGGALGDMEIVGIVNRHAHGMEDRSKPAPNVFVPLAQKFHPVLFLTARSAAKIVRALLQPGAYRRELLARSRLPILRWYIPGLMEEEFTLPWLDRRGDLELARCALLASVGVLEERRRPSTPHPRDRTGSRGREPARCLSLIRPGAHRLWSRVRSAGVVIARRPCARLHLLPVKP